jgi:hypothetical protein
MKAQIALAAALATALISPLAASAQPYGGMMMHHGNGRSATGRIASVQGSSFTLDNGRTVFLKSGTQINGGHIHPGAMVSVSGSGAGNHNINAAVVTILHRH